jgi:predicted esterase
MKCSAILGLLLLLHTAGISAPKIQKETFTSHNKKRTYYLFVPETIKPSEPAPLIVLLHGSGRDGLSLVDKWQDLANKEGFVIVGLDAAGQGWSTTADGPSVLHDLVETLKSKYPINSRRVYLFGHSAGAVYAIDLSMMESEYFAATAIHAGGWREKREFDQIKHARRKIPLAIWIGTQDQFFPLQSVRATRDALVASGFPVEMTEMPGHDHWYYDLAPSINEAAWQFLKKYELPAEPQFEEYAEAGETSSFNKVVGQGNAIQSKANDLVARLDVKDRELNAKDFITDRAEVNRLAREEVDLIKEASALLLTASDKVNHAANLKLSDKYRRYLDLIGRYYGKFAEVLDAKREQTEALLGNESYDVIVARQNEIKKRIDKLQQEADDLQQQAMKVMQ